jgi:mannose-6-phosphate isomerase-like protein (cupin superfamily)
VATTAEQTTIPAVESGEREGLWFIDALATVHVRGEDTGGAAAVVEMLSPAGSMPPLHVHAREDETFYVMEGEMEFYVGDSAPVRVEAGGCAVAPRGVPHSFKVTSPEPARYLVVATPAGFEDFVAEVSDPAPQGVLPPAGAPPDMGRIVAAAETAGITILAPPGTLPGEV